MIFRSRPIVCNYTKIISTDLFLLKQDILLLIIYFNCYCIATSFVKNKFLSYKIIQIVYIIFIGIKLRMRIDNHFYRLFLSQHIVFSPQNVRQHFK